MTPFIVYLVLPGQGARRVRMDAPDARQAMQLAQAAHPAGWEARGARPAENTKDDRYVPEVRQGSVAL